jgi:hypothetical protein
VAVIERIPPAPVGNPNCVDPTVVFHELNDTRFRMFR